MPEDMQNRTPETSPRMSKDVPLFEFPDGMSEAMPKSLVRVGTAQSKLSWFTFEKTKRVPQFRINLGLVL